MPNYNKGWKHTPEARKKISEGHKGIKKSQSWILKIVESKRRRGTDRIGALKAWNTKRLRGTDKHTPEHRKKISEANKGRTVWNKGKVGVFSKATRKKMSEAAIKIWDKRRELKEKEKSVNDAVVITAN